MKISLFSRAVAGMGAVMLLAMNASSFLVVNAAPTNIADLAVTGGTGNATAVANISFTPSNPLTNGSTIIVSYPAAFTDGSLVAGDVAVANGAADLTHGTIVVSTAAKTITIPVTTAGTAGSLVTLTLSNAHLTSPASPNPSLATFTVSTSVGDGGADVVSVNNGDQVTVSATVLPTLTLSLDSTSLAFGTLDSTVKTAVSNTTKPYIQVGIATNAQGGAIVTMADAHNGALQDGHGDTIPAATSALTPATSGVTYDVATVNGSSTVTAGTYLNLTGGNAPVLDTNHTPSAGVTANIESKATISATQVAGNYADTLTFTAAGTF